MLKSYFIDFNKKIMKKTAASKTAAAKSTSKSAAKKGTAKKAVKKTSSQIDLKSFAERINGVVPQRLKVESVKIIDSSGFSPEGADLIAYNEYCRDIVKLFNGYVPYELVYGAYFAVNNLVKNSLADVLGRVATVKKINHFVETESVYSVPCFILAATSEEYPLLELKNDIVNYYMSTGIESESEFEIFGIINYGIIIKDWHQGKRSFVALETGEDTLLWFYVLMNEYLDENRDDEFDLRSYVRADTSYNEF